jgi:hypothetical protein
MQEIKKSIFRLTLYLFDRFPQQKTRIENGWCGRKQTLPFQYYYRKTLKYQFSIKKNNSKRKIRDKKYIFF